MTTTHHNRYGCSDKRFQIEASLTKAINLPENPTSSANDVHMYRVHYVSRAECKTHPLTIYFNLLNIQPQMEQKARPSRAYVHPQLVAVNPIVGISTTMSLCTMI